MESSFGWCSVSDCRSYRQEAFSTQNETNASNFSCPGYPFCVLMLTTTINHSNVRIFDLFLVFGNAVFLLVLFVHMVPTIRKLSHSLPLFKILYSLVFLIPVISLIHGLVSMSLGYQDLAAKLTHVVVRGSILMTEMSVVLFGLFFSELTVFRFACPLPPEFRSVNMDFIPSLLRKNQITLPGVEMPQSLQIGQ